MSSPTSATSPSSPLSPSEYIYRAVDAYTPRHEGEIALSHGDIVTDSKDLGNGWTLGRNVTRDSLGIFPTRLIRPMSDVAPCEPSVGSPGGGGVRGQGALMPGAGPGGGRTPDGAAAGPGASKAKPKPPRRTTSNLQSPGTDPRVVAGEAAQARRLGDHREAGPSCSGPPTLVPQRPAPKYPPPGALPTSPAASLPLSTCSEEDIEFTCPRSPQHHHRGVPPPLHGQRSLPHTHPAAALPPPPIDSDPDLTPSDVEYNSLPTPKRSRVNSNSNPKPHNIMVVKPNNNQGIVPPGGGGVHGGCRHNNAGGDPTGVLVAPQHVTPMHVHSQPGKVRVAHPPGQLPLHSVAGPATADPTTPLGAALPNATDIEKCYDQVAALEVPCNHQHTMDRSTSPITVTGPSQIGEHPHGHPHGGHPHPHALAPHPHHTAAANNIPYDIEHDNAANETRQNHASSPQMTPKNNATTTTATTNNDPGQQQQGGVAEVKKRYYRDYRTLECPAALLEAGYPPAHRPARYKPILRNRNQKVADSKGQHIYYREPADKRTSSRLLISILVAFLIGVVQFLWMYYYLAYTFLVACALSVATAIILVVLFALSRMVRCTAALALPSICTIRGRLSFIILISGFLLGGPVTNIYHNMAEISRSMSCSADQTYNQTMLLLRPFDEMMRHLNVTIMQLQEAAYNVSIGLRPLDEGLDAVEMDIFNGRLQLYGTKKSCNTMVDRAYNACATGITTAQDQCLTVVLALGNVYHQAIDVLDKFNPQHWAGPNHRLLLKKRQVIIGGEDGEGGGGAGVSPADKDMCEALDSTVCQVLNDSLRLCQPSGWAGEAIQEAINATQQAMHTLQSTLQFTIDPDPYHKARESERQYEVQKLVQAEFDARTRHFELVISILMKFVPLAVIILIYVAYNHVKSFLANDTYDNTYITEHFRALDQKRAEVAGESLLPLKKYERNFLVDTTSSDLSPPEDGLYRIGLTVLILHLILSFFCYMFDYILYWILALIERYATPMSDFTGTDSLKPAVDGEGVIVELLHVFLEHFHAGSWYGFTGDTMVCVPRPFTPSVIYLLVIFLLYFILILCILLKAYMLRFRNRITGFFFPERRKARTVHLYNVILNQRSRMPKLLHQKARLNHRERQIMEQISFCRFLGARCPPCRVFLYKSSRCLVCESVEDQTFRDCETEKCYGVYCADCFDDLGRICPLCLHGVEYSDDEEYEEMEDDLQPYHRSSKIYL